MEILLIEDNEHKKARIEKLLTQSLIKPVLSFASSVQEGLKFLRNRKPDLILLDMSLPVFNYSVSESGFQHNSYAGKDVFEYLDNFELIIPVIVITAFTTFGGETDAMTLEELHVQFTKFYPEQYIGSVWYSSLEDIWQDNLLKLIESTNKI